MKIGQPADKPLPAVVGNGASGASVSAPVPHASAGASAIPAQADASAKIELSSVAGALLSGSSSAEFDTDKVASITRSIDAGTFKIDAGAIADKLIANAQELLGPAKKP